MFKLLWVCAMGLLGVYALSHSEHKKLEFIDADFDSFASRLIEQEQERNMFALYFANLMDKIRNAHEVDQQKEKATYRYLYSLALKELEKKHVDWYQEIKPFVSDVRFTLDDQFDELRRIIKLFLTRYGAYEEFLTFKMNKLPEAVEKNLSKGTWDTIKDYAYAAKNKIAGWFDFGSNTASTA